MAARVTEGIAVAFGKERAEYKCGFRLRLILSLNGSHSEWIAQHRLANEIYIRETGINNLLFQ
jgi:hypothetical protein